MSFQVDLTAETQQVNTLLSASSAMSLSTGFLARRVDESGWVTSNSGALLLWLPKDRRNRDGSDTQISADSIMSRHLVLNFSNFVCGSSWTSAAAGSLSSVAQPRDSNFI